MRLTISLEKDEQFARFLQESIREFNNVRSVYHRESRKEGYIKPIHIRVEDENGNWTGGITASVYWNWVEIDEFWLHEDIRGKGIGSQLLDKVESIAREMGAKKALLTTYEFQARTFYEGKDYQVVCELKDYPPGTSYYTLVKELES